MEMYGIVGTEHGSAFPDMARDKNGRQLDFKTIEAAKEYANDQDYKTFQIVLTSGTCDFARRVLGVRKCGR